MPKLDFDIKWKGVVLEAAHALTTDTLEFAAEIIIGELIERKAQEKCFNTFITWLESLPKDTLIKIKTAVSYEIDMAEESDSKQYLFGFFVGDQIVDHCYLDENNEDVALDTFLIGHKWGDKIPSIQVETAYVELLDEVEGGN